MNLKKWLEKHSGGKEVFIWFLLANLVYASMWIFTIPVLDRMAGGLPILDLRPSGYTLSEVQELMGALGSEGRQFYLTRQIPLDLIYPFLYGISFSLIITYFLRRLKRLQGPLVYLSFLPLLAGLADYLENWQIFKILRQYPDITEGMVKMSSSFSLLKSGATTVFMFLILGLLIWTILGYLKKKRQT